MQNTIRRQLNGKSTTKLVVSGDARAVREEIYRLFNAGVISGMPYGMENPDEEEKHEGPIALECATYKGRFFSGLQTLADLELQKELPPPVTCAERREWRGLRSERADVIFTRDFSDKEEAEETESEE